MNTIDKINQVFSNYKYFISIVAILFFTIVSLNIMQQEHYDISNISNHPEIVNILFALLVFSISVVIIIKKIHPLIFAKKYLWKGWKNYWYYGCEGLKIIASIGLFLLILIGFFIFILTNDTSNAFILVIMLIFSDMLLLIGIVYYLFFKTEALEYILDIVHKFIEFDWIDDKAEYYIEAMNENLYSFLLDNTLSFILVWILGRLVVNILAVHVFNVDISKANIEEESN